MRRILVFCLVFFSVFSYWEENWNYRNLYRTEGGKQVFINFSENQVLLTDLLGNKLNHSFGDGGIWGEGADFIWVYYNGSGNQTGPVNFDFYSEYCEDCRGGNYSKPILVSWYGKINNRAGFDKASFVKINGDVFGESCYLGSCIKDKLFIDDQKNHSYKIVAESSIKYFRDGALIYQRTGFVPSNFSLNFSGNHYNVTVRDSKDKTWFVKNQSKLIGGFDVFDIDKNFVTYSGTEVLCGDWVLANLSGICVINGTYESGAKLLSGCFEIYCYDNWTGLAFDKFGKRVVEESDGSFVVFGEGNYSFSNGTHFVDFHNSEGGWDNFSLGENNLSVYIDKTPPKIEVFGPETLVLYNTCETIEFGFFAQDDYLVSHTKNFSEVICDDYNFEYFANDSSENFVGGTWTVLVGNVTQNTVYSLINQTYWITDNASLPIYWKAKVFVNFSGKFSSDILIYYLNYSAQIPFDFEGNKSFEFYFSNDSLSVSLVEGSCNNYTFSKIVEKTSYFRPPSFNPETSQILPQGMLNGTWWGVSSGNFTDIEVCVGKGRQPGYFFCGDGICTESCSWCSIDCGNCQSSSHQSFSEVTSRKKSPEDVQDIFLSKGETFNKKNNSEVTFTKENESLDFVNYTKGVVELKFGVSWLKIIGKLLKNPFNYLLDLLSW